MNQKWTIFKGISLIWEHPIGITVVNTITTIRSKYNSVLDIWLALTKLKIWREMLRKYSCMCSEATVNIL